MVIGKPSSARERIILALDVNTIEEAEKLVVDLKDYVGYFKVGLQLFSAVGYSALDMIKSHGCKAFFDTKPIDIPNTVAKTCVNFMKNGVDFFDIHLIGGSKMVGTTAKLIRETAKKLEIPCPTVLGVTLLSSFGQRRMRLTAEKQKSLGRASSVTDRATPSRATFPHGEGFQGSCFPLGEQNENTIYAIGICGSAFAVG